MAANLPPLGDIHVPHINVVGIEVEGIDFGQVPTNEQICMETHRLLEIERAQERSGQGFMNHDEYADSQCRHHTIMRLATEPQLNPNLQNFTDWMNGPNGLQGVADIRATMAALANQVAALGAQVTAMGAQVTAMGAQVTAQIAAIGAQVTESTTQVNAFIRSGSAREANKAIANMEGYLHIPFASLPKVIPGHPYINVLPVNGAPDFEAAYLVGADPPVGLMPVNGEELIRLGGDTLPNLRRRLRAIYWFYNESRLQIAGNASHGRCIEVLDVVSRFLKSA